METQTLLWQVALVLVAARIFAEAAAWLGIPRVLGELCAGIVLGPSILGWIAPSEPIKLLAEIGIILLLFEIGLHTDLSRLVRARGGSLILALGGFLAPFILGYFLCAQVFGLTPLVSLFIGGTLTATSIGLTVRILRELGQHASREGQVVLGAAVIDDLLGVALLAILHEFAVTGDVSLGHAGRIMLFVGAFFLLAPIAAKLLSQLIRRVQRLSAAPGMIPAMLVALVLGFAALASMMGAPELLGGFAAGIALSRRFFLPLGLTFRVDAQFNRQVHQQMKPIIQLFTPIFFVMVGLSLDLSAVDWTSGFIWLFSISLAIAAIAGKLLGGLFVPANPYARVAMGMAMVPRGEVGLVFAELGRVSGIFDDQVYAGVIIVIAYTTLLAPFWIKLYYQRFGQHFARGQPRQGILPLRGR